MTVPSNSYHKVCKKKDVKNRIPAHAYTADSHGLVSPP